MKADRFEDLQCWQQARALTRYIYACIKRSDFSEDDRLSAQMCGACISLMRNICEGVDARSNKEFIRFLKYSKRSCSDVQNGSYIALDQKYITEYEFQTIYKHSAKIRKMIKGLIRQLEKS